MLDKRCKSIYHLGASQGVLAGGKGVSSLSVEGVGISAIKSTYQSQLKSTSLMQMLVQLGSSTSPFLPGTEALPEKEAGNPETLTLFGQRLIFSSVSFSAMAYSFTSSDTPTI